MDLKKNNLELKPKIKSIFILLKDNYCLNNKKSKNLAKTCFCNQFSAVLSF